MEDSSFELGLDFARELDIQDELASFREAFVIADPDLLYMDGNSLGRLPRRATERLQTVLETEWGERLISGWKEGWYEAPARIGDKLALLLGAGPGQVILSDATSVNLFKLTMAALSLRSDRTRIVSDVLNFPTDLYVIQGCIRLLGHRHTLHLIPSQDEIEPDKAALLDAIDEQTALVTLSHPTFKSAFAYDVQAITARAHRVGALVLLDLSHAVGVIPLRLDDWGVDFAVGCTYKYINGGPGAPAFLYVRQDQQAQVLSPIWGWWAHRSPFAFELEYEPTAGISRFLSGTPPILS